MAWARLDDNFPHHPKVFEAGPVAAYLFVCGICYCRKFQTGGFIPSTAVRQLGVTTNPKRLIKTLTDVGLWVVSDGGYQIHGYAEMYDDDATKAEKDERRRQKQEAGRKGGHASWRVRSASSRTEAEPKHPIEAHKDRSGDGSGVRSSEQELSPEQIGAEFQQFLAAFHPSGRRGGPLPFGYFDRARRSGVRFEDMRAALENHLASAQWASGKVPSLVTWLQDQWWHTRLEPAKAAKRDVFDEFVKAGK